jgi:hypothetical protein
LDFRDKRELHRISSSFSGIGKKKVHFSHLGIFDPPCLRVFGVKITVLQNSLRRIAVFVMFQ